ncbi:hypothetical protein LSAT2_016082 [Lamellibrachia satsuma]|nr:hypothetical protein LSAT2_016082 [Lamellibrachia satsuma]
MEGFLYHCIQRVIRVERGSSDPLEDRPSHVELIFFLDLECDVDVAPKDDGREASIGCGDLWFDLEVKAGSLIGT